MRNSQQFRLGRKGEIVVREWLIQHGYTVIELSLIEDGGAPMVKGPDGNMISPDDMIFHKDYGSGFVEVKTKSRATKNNQRKRLEHGIPLYLWKAYRSIQEKTSTPVSLAIVELASKELFLAPTDDIAETAAYYYGDKMSDGLPHIFFDVGHESTAFSVYPLDKLGDLIPKPVKPKTVRLWEHPGVKRPWEISSKDASGNSQLSLF